ncbi:hypothetical protein EMCRGX_G020106 [Ephydatia muelleri]
MTATHRGDSPASDDGDCEEKSAKGYIFNREVIKFSLYGKALPSMRRYSEQMEKMLVDAQNGYKNMPSIFHFALSAVNLVALGVYTSEPLPKGTLLGPYVGRAILRDHLDSHHRSHSESLWEIYQDGVLLGYIDAAGSKYGNWMMLIQCARHVGEQNLRAVQPYNGCLYFETTRDVAAHEELLVWYDEEQYSLYMGIPSRCRMLPSLCGMIAGQQIQAADVSIGDEEPIGDSEETVQSTTPRATGMVPIRGAPLAQTESPPSSSPSPSSSLVYGMFSRSKDGTTWNCEECKRVFLSQGSLRAHARIHTGERPYRCRYCHRTFCQASTLKSHERLHTGEKPYKCKHCGRSFTQSAGLRSHMKTHRYDNAPAL